MTDTISAQLDISFEVVGGRTILARRRVGYPFNVTAVLRTGEAFAEVIVQSVSGGLFGGEISAQIVRAHAGAHVLVRLPSAVVAHASRSGSASRHSVRLVAEADATMRYLQRPLILFPGSVIQQIIEIVVAAGATVMFRDGFMRHDPYGMPVTSRSLRSVVTVRRLNGRLLALDRIRISDSTLAGASAGVTNRFRAFGTIWLIRQLDPASMVALEKLLMPLLTCQTDCYAAVSALRDDGGAILRVAAVDGGALDLALDAAIVALSGFLGRVPEQVGVLR